MGYPNENNPKNGQQHFARTVGGHQRPRHRPEAEPANRDGFPAPMSDRTAHQARNRQRDGDEQSDLVNIMAKEDGPGGRHECNKQGTKETMHEAKPRKTDGDSIKKGI